MYRYSTSTDVLLYNSATLATELLPWGTKTRARPIALALVYEYMSTICVAYGIFTGATKVIVWNHAWNKSVDPYQLPYLMCTLLFFSRMCTLSTSYCCTSDYSSTLDRGLA